MPKLSNDSCRIIVKCERHGCAQVQYGECHPSVLSPCCVRRIRPSRPISPTRYRAPLVKHYGLTDDEIVIVEGKVIADSKAFRVMAKAIEAMGVDKVAALGVLCGGEPLVTQDKAQFKKHPSAVAEIAGGWFVKTHSGTAAKINYIKRIAKALKVKLVVANV